MLNVKMLPLSIQSKWEKEVHMGVVIEDYNLSFIYCVPPKVPNIITFPKDVNQTFFGFCIKCT
jgi:hypothetical protein